MADQTEKPVTSDHHFCAHCGTENDKGGYACTRCGERLVEVVAESVLPGGLNSCSRCGGANYAQAGYCWGCGLEMKESIRITPTPAPELEIPSAAAPRTYRPDLNPVSTSVNKPATDQPADPSDLRGSADSSTNTDPELTISQQNPFGSADSPEENTSGTRSGEVPAEVKKWNWAAFLMPHVWGLFSGVPYAAVLFGAGFLPLPAQIIVMISASLYLGARGNELAWKGKKWRSVEHFNAFQKRWTSWVVITSAVGVILLLYYMANGGA